MNPKLTEILACPLCKGKLGFFAATNELICRFDKLAFPIDDDIPVLLEERAREMTLEEMDQGKS